MTASAPNGSAILSTLDKGLRVLEMLARPEAAEGLTLTELANRLGMHRTTLFRFLATLRARGYVEREAATDRYRLGIGVLTMASSLLHNLDVRRIARPILLDLRNSTQELVHLAVMNEDGVVTVDRFEGQRALSLQTEVGSRRPAYCTAAGKAILAYLPAARVAAILADGMPEVTPRTITTPEAMHRQLVEIRRLGYAVDNEERTDGVRCVAAAVFGHEGEPVAAISLAAPTMRFPAERVAVVGEEVAVAAVTISRRLGFSVREVTHQGGMAAS
ncbi:MAG: IclR family transcriptional regulator [Chloroflexia bacterium]|nr:IclR family transcriptional regulator [Chloroflexia bacterium]